MRERFEHLSAIESAAAGGACSTFPEWPDTRLDRWLVDWALRNGKEQTARKIAREKSLEVRESTSRLEHCRIWSLIHAPVDRPLSI
jgi:hypothetical protein